jgi:ferrochelatase
MTTAQISSSGSSQASKNTLRGALLLNVGTPASPRASDVKEYLREFLMDPYVIDIPWLFRWFLVNGLILRNRPESSAQAYQKIWTERGSPLLFHLIDLKNQVQSKLGDGWLVKAAMRYGEPDVEDALQEFQEAGVSEVILFPLYPQYSLAATETGSRYCSKIAKKLGVDFPIRMIGPFFQEESFIRAFAQVAENSLRDYQFDHILFSFHGLPERQIKKTDLTGSHCLSSPQCCDRGIEFNPQCYRAQCYVTAQKIAEKLNLKSQQYTVCFQSRLGRTPWIKPYTDEFYRQLPSQGVKKLAVICPAFVADCLETLEEVQMRGKEEFIQWGGEDLRLVPSLNASEEWVKSVVELLKAGRTEPSV